MKGELPFHAEADLIVGSGVAVSRPTLLHGVVFTPVTANDYAVIYSGRDAVSGTKLFKVISAVVVTWSLYFGHPIYCPNGVYVDGIDDEVETTILHEAL